MTLKQFKKKYDGNGIAYYKSIYAMRNDILRHIAFYKAYPNEHSDQIIRQYERMLRDLKTINTVRCV